MSLGHSPKLVTNGLVLCLDAANIKSYTGVGNSWINLSSSVNSANLVASPVAFNFSNLGNFSFGDTTGTNTLASSLDFSGSGWVQNGATIVSNAGTAPDGTLTASTIAGTRIYQFDNSGVLAAKVFTIFAKALVGSSLQISFVGGFSNSGTLTVDLSNGTASGTPASVTTITSFPNGWYRISVRQTVSIASGNSTYIQMQTPSTSVYIWGVDYRLGYTTNATTNYVTVPYSSTLDFSTALTVSLWYYSGTVFVDAAQSLSGSYLKGRTDFDTYNPLFQVDGKYLWGAAAISPGVAFYNPPANYIVANTWYNLTATHVGGSDPKIYKNGVLSTEHTYTTGNGTYALVTNLNPVTINGDVPRGLISNFNGKIAAIHAYNRALSAAEIQQNFNALRGRFGI